MKPRNSRSTGEPASGGRTKTEVLNSNGPAATQQTSAQAIRKRRSSINVYDQPSSLNARLRQLETDMLRLDEDRSKLFDDTHSSLAQFEIRLNEIQSILKSRQDNVEKYVEEMKLLLAAKEEFEKQSKLLNEKHERMQDKFMHRETTISRDIKLLKIKFDLLEKNRQFRSILQQCKSNEKTGDTWSTQDTASGQNSDSRSSSHDAGGAGKRMRDSLSVGVDGLAGRTETVVPNADKNANRTTRKKRIKNSKLGFFGRMLKQLGRPFEWLSLDCLSPRARSIIPRSVSNVRHGLRNNRVSSIITKSKLSDDFKAEQDQPTGQLNPDATQPSDHPQLSTKQQSQDR